jgi:peroxiredoxin Q/BCP
MSDEPKKKSKDTTKKIKASPKKSTFLGKVAPEFVLPTATGELISLKELRGKRVVLYFYPKDDTPGCAAQAQSFRDSRLSFSRKTTVIIGISKDSIGRHSKFKKKYKLNFTLASDAESNVCETYGVWKEKNMYGHSYMGIERSTFLIDEKGIVRTEWRKVRVPGHIDEVIQVLKSL